MMKKTAFLFIFLTLLGNPQVTCAASFGNQTLSIFQEPQVTEKVLVSMVRKQGRLTTLVRRIQDNGLKEKSVQREKQMKLNQINQILSQWDFQIPVPKKQVLDWSRKTKVSYYLVNRLIIQKGGILGLSNLTLSRINQEANYEGLIQYLDELVRQNQWNLDDQINSLGTRFKVSPSTVVSYADDRALSPMNKKTRQIELEGFDIKSFYRSA